MASDRRVVRLGVLGIVTALLFSALGTRLWFLQNANGQALEQSLNQSRTKRVFAAPQRGRIFDAQGRILADNERVINLVIEPEQLTRNTQRRHDYFDRLHELLGYETWIDIELRYCGADPDKPLVPREPRKCGGKFDPRAPFPVAEDVTEDLANMLLERREDFPGLSKVVTWRRRYPFAPLASHIVGYLGSIPSGEDGKRFLEAGYLPNEKIGAAGVERTFEEDLHGTWGWEQVRIDSNGNIIGRVPGGVLPTPGRDIQLTIDLRVQQFAEQTLETQLKLRRVVNPYQAFLKKPPLAFTTEGNYPAPAGAVVVERKHTGEILAMASYPTFDNRWFGSGATVEKFKQIFPDYELDANGQPLRFTEGKNKGKPVPLRYSPFNNLAIQGRYNVGSTFKPFTAYSAIANAFIGPSDPYLDPSIYTIPKEFCDKAKGFKCDYRNANNNKTGKPSYHGTITVSDALALSTDTYFYRIGAELFLQNRTDPALQRTYREFGFGEKTGVDLPFEYRGVVPDKAIKQRLAAAGAISKREGESFYVGDSVQMAIGQGLLAVTPLQLTNAYATLSNGGNVLKPLIARAIYEPGTPDLTDGTADLARGKIYRSFAPTAIRTLWMDSEVVGEIDEGLRRVVRGPGKNVDGDRKLTTGQKLFEGFPAEIEIAGKTGTAQGLDGMPHLDSSAFVAYERGDAGEYVIGAYLERSGYGSQGAAPVVKCLFLLLRAGYPADPVLLSEALDVNATVATPPKTLADQTCLALPVDAGQRER